MALPAESVNSDTGFMPHGMCYLWQSDVLYLHVIADALTALAYYSIPIALIYFVVKRKNVTEYWLIIMFALFILACGTTHLMGIWTIWDPAYWAEGVIKGVTALVSVATAVAMWYIMPEVLVLPTPGELVAVNERLQSELSERKRYQDSLKRAHSRLKQQVRLSLISEMNSRLQTCKVVSDVNPIVAQYLPRLFPESSGAVYVYGAPGSMIELAATWGLNPPAAERFTPDQCRALQQGSMYVARFPSSREDLPCEHYENDSASNCICMPLIANDEGIGLLHLRMPDGGGRDVDLEDSQQDVTVATTAKHLSLALVNIRHREQLEFQSVRDPLTNLYNRRYLEESFAREISRSQRSGEQVAVLMLDLDHFKDVNDSYGHEAGDAVLREIASFMNRNVRAEDIVARYGGEEFVIIMPGINIENTRQKAELIRRGVRSLTVVCKDQQLSDLGISIGVAVYPTDSEDVNSLLGLADSALYHAKNTGRDKVVFYSEIAGNGNTD